jgi:DNA-3-methyladenine glycosylase
MTSEPFVSERRITREFFDRPVQIVTRAIVGHHIYFHGLGGMVTEAEAYDRSDPASHGFRGLNQKNRAMFGAPGTIYIYLYRGMWPHLNLVCQQGSAVLIRALLPDQGKDQIITNRKGRCKGSIGPNEKHCSGPGRVGLGLGLKLDADSFPLIDGPDFALYRGGQRLPIIRGTRINVGKNPTPEWRWAIQTCPSVSEPFENPVLDGFTGNW